MIWKERGEHMGRKHVDFNKLMLAYNKRFGKDYGDVGEWLSDLRGRLSIRAMSRLIKVDRAVLTRELR